MKAFQMIMNSNEVPFYENAYMLDAILTSMGLEGNILFS